MQSWHRNTGDSNSSTLQHPPHSHTLPNTGTNRDVIQPSFYIKTQVSMGFTQGRYLPAPINGKNGWQKSSRLQVKPFFNILVMMFKDILTNSGGQKWRKMKKQNPKSILISKTTSSIQTQKHWVGGSCQLTLTQTGQKAGQVLCVWARQLGRLVLYLPQCVHWRSPLSYNT